MIDKTPGLIHDVQREQHIRLQPAAPRLLAFPLRAQQQSLAATRTGLAVRLAFANQTKQKVAIEVATALETASAELRSDHHRSTQRSRFASYSPYAALVAALLRLRVCSRNSGRESLQSKLSLDGAQTARGTEGKVRAVVVVVGRAPRCAA